MTRTLGEFQEEVLTFADRRGRMIYADPMGARKTATTLAWLRRRESAQRICLVVPGGVLKHWADEAKEWYPEAIVRIGQGPKRAEALLTCLWNSDEGGSWPTIYITTYDAMKIDADKLVGQFDTWVFDEGHRLKGRTTGVAKIAYKMTAKVQNILAVTGTPVLNHPEELWFYLHMMFRKTFTSFWSWAEEHFVVKLEMYNGRAVKVIGDYLPGHAEIVRKQLETVMIQRDDKELFPDAAWTQDAVFTPHYVTLSPEELHLYDKLVRHCWAEFPSKVVTAANKLAVTTRLRQLVSDWGTVDPTVAYGTKVEYAANLVRSRVLAGGPVVVFTEYTATAARMHEILSKSLRAGLYTGHHSPKQREATKAAFTSGQLDVIIGTYGSMKEGVDGLQKVSHQMVMVDLLWVYGLVMQAVGRLRRDGQEQQVHVDLVVAAGTVDITVLRANLTKNNVVKTLKGQALDDIIFGHNFDLQLEAQ